MFVWVFPSWQFFVTSFWIVKWPFQRISGFHLGDKKGHDLNDLVTGWCFFRIGFSSLSRFLWPKCQDASVWKVPADAWKKEFLLGTLHSHLWAQMVWKPTNEMGRNVVRKFRGPGDSTPWPFYPLVGGHVFTSKRVKFPPSQKGHQQNNCHRGHFSVEFFFLNFLWAWRMVLGRSNEHLPQFFSAIPGKAPLGSR